MNFEGTRFLTKSLHMEHRVAHVMDLEEVVFEFLKLFYGVGLDSSL
jgi:hypothetical protein